MGRLNKRAKKILSDVLSELEKELEKEARADAFSLFPKGQKLLLSSIMEKSDPEDLISTMISFQTKQEPGWTEEQKRVLRDINFSHLAQTIETFRNIFDFLTLTKKETAANEAQTDRS